MYKSYDITLEFIGSLYNIKEQVYPLVNPEHDADNVDLDYFLKKLEIEPKDGIEIYGGYIDYSEELSFTIDINKKENEMVALDFIYEIYKKIYNKIGEFKEMEVDLIIRVIHGDLYYK